MDRAKVLKRIQNLQKIKGIIEIAKFDTLQKLAETDRIKKYHYEIAEVSREVIKYSKSKFHISNKLNKQIKTDSNKLFIYITIPSELLNVSHEKLDMIVASEFDKGLDKLIVVGDPAATFAKRNKIKPEVFFKDLENDLFALVAVVTALLNKNIINEVRIVANTSAIKDHSYKLFPIELENEQDLKHLDKMKFYYSLSDVIEQIANNYFENILEGIYKEAYREFYKEKLVRHEASITQTDDRIHSLKLELHKARRKKETEEMIHVSQIAKRR